MMKTILQVGSKNIIFTIISYVFVKNSASTDIDEDSLNSVASINKEDEPLPAVLQPASKVHFKKGKEWHM